MKFKIILLFGILLLTFIGIEAQPGCSRKFNPFSLCGTDYKTVDYIFYGEIISFEKSPQPKAIVEVKKLFKGQLSAQIELFVDPNEVFCEGLPAKATYIFTASKGKADDNFNYFSRKWSDPVTDYSKQGLKEIFGNIRSMLRNKKAPSLEGFVLQVRADPRDELEMTQEERNRLLYMPDSYNVFPNVVVEARSETDGKVYRTKTNRNGKYVFKNIPLGKYNLKAFVKGKEVFPKIGEATGKTCHHVSIIVKPEFEKND